MDAAQITRGDRMPVFSLRGEIYVVLSDGDDDGYVMPGDFDGNGVQDIVVQVESVVETIKFFKPHCLPLGEVRLQAEFFHPLVADPEGDGRDAFLNLESSELAAYHPGGERTVVPGWPYERWNPTAALDLDGDGADELVSLQSSLFADNLLDRATGQYAGLPEDAGETDIAVYVNEHARPRGGYLNVGTGQFVELNFPAASYRFNVYLGEPGEAVALDLDGDGIKELVTKAALGSNVMAFNTGGDLVYHEEFGRAALNMGICRSDAGEHLVIQLDDRLIVWP